MFSLAAIWSSESTSEQRVSVKYRNYENRTVDNYNINGWAFRMRGFRAGTPLG